jgi:acyl-CoA dehydrogenase
VSSQDVIDVPKLEPGRPVASQRRALHVLAAFLREEAASVDQEVRFPGRSLDALRRSGLMGLLVPVERGGMGGTAGDLALVGRALGSGCLSTALIYTMHCQQVAVLSRHAPPRFHEEILPAIAAGEVYIASVTTEAGKGAHLTSAFAPLTDLGERYGFVRDAPVVTGGGHADAFLVTMRRSPDASHDDVVLAYLTRDQLDIEQRGAWATMGVRGTQSAGMRLTGELPQWQLIDPPAGFAHVAAVTMIPVGHVAWASSWLGAAEGALREVVAAMKDPKQRKRLRRVDDDLTAERMARVRIAVDSAEAFLRCYAQDYDRVLAAEGPTSTTLKSAAFHIRTNNLKVLASEASFAAVDGLMTLTGLAGGYTSGDRLPVERSFRDLRSAALMYSNDRLLVASGKLALFDSRVEPFVDLLDGGRQQ